MAPLQELFEGPFFTMPLHPLLVFRRQHFFKFPHRKDNVDVNGIVPSILLFNEIRKVPKQ